MAEIKLDDVNFEETVLKAKDVFLVDFWAPWCGPCMRIAPVIAEIANDNEGKIKVGKVNTDEAPATAARFQISSIPTLIIFKGGKPYVDRLTLTFPVINKGKQIVLMISGKKKASVVKTALKGIQPGLPAQLVQPLKGTLIWLLDREAASLLD